jgi:hypothetical protein
MQILLLLTIGRVLPPSNRHDAAVVIRRESEMGHSTATATSYFATPDEKCHIRKSTSKARSRSPTLDLG